MSLDGAEQQRARRTRVGRTVDRRNDVGRLQRHRPPGHAGSVAYPGGVPRLRLAAAQLDLVVGDLDGNVDRMLDAYERADAAGCDLVAFPELSLTGYPPEDLLLRPSFVARAGEALDKFAARTGRLAAVVGFPEAQRDLANAAALCAHGRVLGVYRKHLLPNYAVFDEQRYFVPSTVDGPLFVVAGVRVALTICEDAWSPNGPITTQAAGGAELVVNINASPFYAGRIQERETMLATRAADASVPVLYVNLVGGQDELVFDGASMMFDESGHLIARARQFEEDLLVVDVDVRPAFRRRLLDPRGRSRARCPPRGHGERGASRRAARGTAGRAVAAAGAGGLRGAGARHARLRAARTASPTCSSACRAASTRRWWRRSRSTHSARSR